MADLEKPTAERIARTLIIAAVLMDELSAWVLHDEAALRADIELNSRYVALAALAATYPAVQAEHLALCIGFFGAPQRLAWARLQHWWDNQLVERVMVHAAYGPSPFLANCPPADTAARVLAPLVQARIAVINRRVGHAG